MQIIKFFTLLTVVAFMSSCYPDKERTIEDFDLVGTRPADTANFTQYQTFLLHDSLILPYDSTKEKPTYPVETAKIILDGVKQNMLNNGWTEFDAALLSSDTPDVYLEASLWTTKVTGAIYYPGWGYPGYPWYPGWGYGGYPGYGGASYYSYTTGTVMVNMMDIKNHSFSDQVPAVIWHAGLNGLVSSSDANNNSRIAYSINQAFTQSPYLKK